MRVVILTSKGGEDVRITIRPIMSHLKSFFNSNSEVDFILVLKWSYFESENYCVFLNYL